MDTIGARMKAIRKFLGLNQQEMAHDLSISRPHISNIENGNDSPSSSLIRLVCYKYNIDEKWLISGIGSMKPNFGMDSKEGILAKYNEGKVILEKIMVSYEDEALYHTANAFFDFISIVSTNDIPDDCKNEYLKQFSKLLGMIDASIYNTRRISLSPRELNSILIDPLDREKEQLEKVSELACKMLDLRSGNK